MPNNFYKKALIKYDSILTLSNYISGNICVIIQTDEITQKGDVTDFYCRDDRSMSLSLIFSLSYRRWMMIFSKRAIYESEPHSQIYPRDVTGGCESVEY